jgi:membrane protease YdiL (CAAX protease family)
MGESRINFSLYGKSPLSQLFFSFLIILVIWLFLFTFLLLAGKVIFGGDSGNLLRNIPEAVSGKEIAFLRYMLISQEISIFIVPAIVILVLMKPVNQDSLTDLKTPVIIDVVLVIVLAFCIFPITSFTGHLNSGIHLPDWFSGVEGWMKEKEDNAARFLNLLIAADSFQIMIFNLLMLAVLPAIGEELLFRGVFQKILYTLFKSGHLAIWVIAFVFSALHFQFFGFIPRFILGLVFGYLFFWSGNLWLPVISHFVNNAVPVIVAYIQGWDNIKVSSDILSVNQLFVMPVTIIISIIILCYIRTRNKRKVVTSQERV